MTPVLPRAGRGVAAALVAILAVAAGTLRPALARTMEERLQIACRNDIRALCPDKTADETKACMLNHRAQVRTPCMRLIDTSE